MSKLVDAGMTHQVGPCIQTVVVVCVVRGERGGATQHGSLKLFSSSLMPILVEADLIYQVVGIFSEAERFTTGNQICQICKNWSCK